MFELCENRQCSKIIRISNDYRDTAGLNTTSFRFV